MSSDLDVKALLDALVERTQSQERLARMLLVSVKSLRAWLRADTQPQSENVDQILRIARELDVNADLFRHHHQLWNFRRTFEENRKTPPPVAASVSLDPPSPVRFLDTLIDLPFGPSSSVLTSTPELVRFHAQMGPGVIVSKTVRCGELDAHRTPNIYECVDGGYVDPARTPSEVEVREMENEAHPNLGYLNHFGAPSPPPEVWQAETRRALEYLSSGQMFILSIAGMPRQRGEESKLIEDFERAARMANECGVRVIEINPSCPNCFGLEVDLYKNADLLARVCRAVRRAAPTARVIVKIGFMRRGLDELALSIADHADAISAINSLAVHGTHTGHFGREKVFGGRRGGLSGPPILRLGLEMVAALHKLRQRSGNKFEILGIGGVSTPHDVLAYLKAGADVVLATTVFLSNPNFTAQVRKTLWSEHQADVSVVQNQRWRVLQHLSTACEGLRASHSDVAIMRAAGEVMAQWQTEQDRGLGFGPRRAPRVPTVEELRDSINSHLRQHGK